jgi:hypothetical protein
MTISSGRFTFWFNDRTERDMGNECGGKPKVTPAGRQAAEDRQQRLAAALRQNLRKRKAQQRSRSRDPEAPPTAVDPKASDDG